MFLIEMVEEDFTSYGPTSNPIGYVDTEEEAEKAVNRLEYVSEKSDEISEIMKAEREQLIETHEAPDDLSQMGAFENKIEEELKEIFSSLNYDQDVLDFYASRATRSIAFYDSIGELGEFTYSKIGEFNMNTYLSEL